MAAKFSIVNFYKIPLKAVQTDRRDVHKKNNKSKTLSNNMSVRF